MQIEQEKIRLCSSITMSHSSPQICIILVKVFRRLSTFVVENLLSQEAARGAQEHMMVNHGVRFAVKHSAFS